MGKAKGKGSACLDGKEEGRNYRRWEKETLAAYESPLGGTQKSKRKEINSAQQGFSRAVGFIEWLDGAGVIAEEAAPEASGARHRRLQQLREAQTKSNFGNR